MKKLVLFISLSLIGTAWSQDLTQEIIQMNEHLSQLDSYRMSVNYMAAEGTELEEKGRVSVLVSKEGMFYDLGLGSRMMINEEKIILIDDQERSIVFGENQKVRKRNSVNIMDQVIQGMDSLVVQADTILFNEGEKSREYSLRFENGYFDLVQLQFEGAYLTRVQYFYNSDHVDIAGIKNVCSVSYEENAALDKTYLTTEFYLNEENGTMVPSENFNNYLIIYNGALENYLD